MMRLRWLAGSTLRAEDLSVEAQAIARVQALHEKRVHGDGEKSPVVGARIRSVDGSVALSMPALERRSLKPGDMAMLRGWTISAQRTMLSLGWGAGRRILARIFGAVRCGSLSSTAVVFTQAVPEPANAGPFRLFCRAANSKEKKPAAIVIELAAPVKPEDAKENPPTGLRIGGRTSEGFIPLLEVQPGRGVIVRGNYVYRRELVRKPPTEGPTDEQLVQAFLRTEAGKAARAEIEKAKDEVDLGIKRPASVPSGPFNLEWTVHNKTKMKLKNLRAMAAFMPRDQTVSPVWMQLPPPKAATLDPGKDTSGEADMPARDATTGKLVLLLVMEADNGIPITRRAELA